MGFKDMKRNSASQFDKLQGELTKLNSKNERKNDDRFWQPTVGKDGNGFAVIRFLPAPEGENVPFIRRWDHGFQGPTGKWYIELSRTSLGPDEKDPVGELNSELWNASQDDDSPTRKQARKQKRRLHFISNIYVVSDPGNPDNNGKVFLYKYGKKIFDKLNDLMNPAAEFGDEPINPFDLWTGANFRLKIRNFEGYRNYDKSEFDKPAPLLDDDDKLESIYNQEHSLQAFLAPDLFESFEKLAEKLNKVLFPAGGGAQRATAAEKAAKEDDGVPWATDEEAAPKQKTTQAPTFAADEDDTSMDTLALFRQLAEEED